MAATKKVKPAKAPRPAGALKPGYATSEFWVTATAIVGLAAGAVSTALSSANIVPTSVAGWAIAVSAVGYAISRGLAKLFPPKDGP